MPYSKLDRQHVRMKPLAERHNDKDIERDHVAIDAAPRPLSRHAAAGMDILVERIAAAREGSKPVILAFGAHTIKNGLAPVLQQLLADGWLTHLATNGAGVIHDWEFGYQGKSSENVRENVSDGSFGNWEETGFNINLAINIGAYEGLGYGEAVGKFIAQDGCYIPPVDVLLEEVAQADADPERAAAAAALLTVIRSFDLPSGPYKLPHPWKSYSIQAGAFEEQIPFTSHPMFGHDIIYNHPMNNGSLLGRAAESDFLCFAESVSRLDGGVYLSVGSAIMSPMIFEKSMAMAQNLAIQENRHLDKHFIAVVDLAESRWDWSQGEPPSDSPEYYLRYNKSFSRMGGTMRYIQADNRDFLLHLLQRLR